MKLAAIYTVLAIAILSLWSDAAPAQTPYVVVHGGNTFNGKVAILDASLVASGNHVPGAVVYEHSFPTPYFLANPRIIDVVVDYENLGPLTSGQNWAYLLDGVGRLWELNLSAAVAGNQVMPYQIAPGPNGDPNEIFGTPALSPNGELLVAQGLKSGKLYIWQRPQQSGSSQGSVAGINADVYNLAYSNPVLLPGEKLCNGPIAFNTMHRGNNKLWDTIVVVQGMAGTLEPKLVEFNYSSQFMVKTPDIINPQNNIKGVPVLLNGHAPCPTDLEMVEIYNRQPLPNGGFQWQASGHHWMVTNASTAAFAGGNPSSDGLSQAITRIPFGPAAQTYYLQMSTDSSTYWGGNIEILADRSGQMIWDHFQIAVSANDPTGGMPRLYPMGQIELPSPTVNAVGNFRSFFQIKWATDQSGGYLWGIIPNAEVRKLHDVGVEFIYPDQYAQGDIDLYPDVNASAPGPYQAHAHRLGYLTSSAGSYEIKIIDATNPRLPQTYTGYTAPISGVTLGFKFFLNL